MGTLAYRLGLILVSLIAYFTVIKPELEGIRQSFATTTQALQATP